MDWDLYIPGRDMKNIEDAQTVFLLMNWMCRSCRLEDAERTLFRPTRRVEESFSFIWAVLGCRISTKAESRAVTHLDGDMECR